MSKLGIIFVNRLRVTITNKWRPSDNENQKPYKKMDKKEKEMKNNSKMEVKCVWLSF